MGSCRRSPPGVPRPPPNLFWEKTTPVAVKIKLKRLGKIRAPYYRIVVADARTKRDGRAIEEIGKYHPKAEPSFIEVDSERAQHWLSVGAQPTDPVRKILEITGDWQKFKGLPGAEGTLKMAAPREDRKEIFAAAVKETLGDAAPKGKARSGAARDADSGSGRASKAAAKDAPAKEASAKEASAKDTSAKDAPAKADKPARAKAKPDAKAADDGKAAEAKAADDGKAAEAKAAGDGKTAEAKAAGDGKADSDAKAKPKSAAAKGGAKDAADGKADAADGEAEGDKGKAKAGSAASKSKAAKAPAADAEPASGD
jgi:small subunit ribosomal protein S16